MITLIKGRGRDRYVLISHPMDNYDEPANHINHKYHVANGIDRGSGYQGHESVSYFMDQPYATPEAKKIIKDICKKEGLIYKAN